jgi:hypothetical protein
MTMSKNKTLATIPQTTAVAPASSTAPDALTSVPYGVKHLSLLGGLLAQTASSGVDTAKLLTTRFDATTVADLLDIQKALIKRFGELNQNWRSGLTAWGQQCLEIKAANTLSKVVEQECNLVGQLGTLVTKQISDVTSLLESTQVGYAYWLSERLKEAHKA